jgi:hypothetical protein
LPTRQLFQKMVAGVVASDGGGGFHGDENETGYAET